MGIGITEALIASALVVFGAKYAVKLGKRIAATTSYKLGIAMFVGGWIAALVGKLIGLEGLILSCAAFLVVFTIIGGVLTILCAKFNREIDDHPLMDREDKIES